MERRDVVEAIARAFASLVPEAVVFEVARIGPRSIDPREEALVTEAVEMRRVEFATGRWCAARALARAGAPKAPILRGAFREPLWPAGFTGSIAHHGQVAVAAACARDRCTAIGVDLADCADLGPYRQVLDLIRCDGDDLGFVGMHEPIAAAYLFSMKEAAVKCLSPALQTFLDLSKLQVRPATKSCRLVYPGTRLHVVARSTRVDDYVIAFASIDERDRDGLEALGERPR